MTVGYDPLMQCGLLQTCSPVGTITRHEFPAVIPGWLAIGDMLVSQAVSLSQQSAFEISPPGFSVIH